MVQTRRASALRDISNKGGQAAAAKEAGPRKRARASAGGASAAAAGSSAVQDVVMKSEVSERAEVVSAPVQPIDVADLDDVDNPQARAVLSEPSCPIIWRRTSSA